MTTTISFRLVIVPLTLQIVALTLLYLGEGMPNRELLGIWLPWTAIVLIVSLLLFLVFWFGYRVCSIAVRVAALLLVLLFAFFAFVVAQAAAIR